MISLRMTDRLHCLLTAFLCRDRGRSAAPVCLAGIALFLLPAVCLGAVTADYLFEFGSHGREPGSFREPQALALDRSGDIYVADTENHRIQVFSPTGELLRYWGAKGSGRGEFDSPSGITCGNARVYVADTDNHRIQIFDLQGIFLDAFGVRGSDPKEFKRPQGLVWWNSLLYVADTGNDRVQVLSEDGVFLYQIASPEGHSWSLDAPSSISIDQSGNIYIIGERGKVDIFSQKGKPVVPNAISGNAVSLGPDGIYIANRSRLFRFAHDASLKNFFTSAGGNEIMISDQRGMAPPAIHEISALALNSLKNLYVLSSKEGVIRAFHINAQHVAVEPAEMPSSVAFSREIPFTAHLALGHFDNRVFIFDRETRRIDFLTESADGKPRPEYIWLADAENHCLHRFSREGRYLTTVGEKGSGSGQFRYPSAVVLHNNVLYVADSGNARVQILDETGRPINSIGSRDSERGSFSDPAALAFDTQGNLYAADRGLHKIVKMDSSGNVIREFGKKGEEDGEFREPSGIAVINGELYVLDSGNNRIQVFDLNGLFLRKFGSEGKGKGEFRRPSGLGSDGLYNLYVADRDNNRVQALRLLLTPSKPKAVRAEGSIKEVKVIWLPHPDPHVNSYKIFRKQKDQPYFTEIGSMDGSASVSRFAYFDRNLKSDTTYHYAVTAISQTGNSSLMSNTVEATTKRLVPSAPKLLKTEAGQKDIYLEWKPSPEPFTDHYLIMRNNETWQSFQEIEKTGGHSFKDSNLTPNTLYKYKIVAVGIENDLSEPAIIEVTTMKLPTLEIKGSETGDIFSNSYKQYESHPFGTVAIKNNSENTIADITLSLFVRAYMDAPTESVIEKIAGGETVVVPLQAVFNNRILSLTENASVPAEIEVSYFENNVRSRATYTKSLNVFEKHSLIWDSMERASVFVTPKDPLLLELAAAASSGYHGIPLNKTLLKARAVFGALSVLGITYLEDPNSPYQRVSQNISTVDFIQYPRETLSRKAGDCDDLVVLYASLLEGLGINTAFVAYPGHILLMFDTAASDPAGDDFGFPAEDAVIHNGRVWVPVEVTLVGTSFTEAWRKALAAFREWQGRGLQIVEMRDAWQQFKPASLEYADLQMEMITPDKIEAVFSGEITSLRQRRVEHLRSLMQEGSETSRSLEQLAILYGENGMYREAMETLDRYIALNGENATVLNNRGNLHFLQGNYLNAEKLYLKALRYDGGDAGIMINVARCYAKMNKKETARKYLDMAAKLDPGISRTYIRLSSELRR